MFVSTPGARRTLSIAPLWFVLLSLWTGGDAVSSQESRVRSSAAGYSLPPSEPTSAPGAGVDTSWWQTVSTELARQEYQATHGEHGLSAPNRAQNLRTSFRAQGIEDTPRGKPGVGGLRIRGGNGRRCQRRRVLGSGGGRPRLLRRPRKMEGERTSFSDHRLV